MNIVFSCNERL